MQTTFSEIVGQIPDYQTIFDSRDLQTPTMGQLLQTLVINRLPRTNGDISEALQIMSNLSTHRVDLTEINTIEGVVLVNGHHGLSDVPTITDPNLTSLCAAATAIGYAVWGDESRKFDPLRVHQELVASKHNGHSHQLAYVARVTGKPFLGGVVTLVQAHELDPRETLDDQSGISIGFNELLVLPKEVVDQIKSVDPLSIGELTLFTILENFRDVKLKRYIAEKLLEQAVIRAKELDIIYLFAIMPRFVSQLLPKDSFQVVASTSGQLRTSQGSSPELIPIIRKLKRGEPGFEVADQVYTPYYGYWKDENELQLCLFNLNWKRIQ